MTNLEVAELLRAVAASYELKDAQISRFKIIAYERAADAVEHLTSEVKDVYDEGKLEDVPGIGTNIAQYLKEVFSKGYSDHFKKLMKNLPPAMFEMMKIPGVGAKTAFKLSKKLGISKAHNALKRLSEAVKENRIKYIEGFGELSQTSIGISIDKVRKSEKRLIHPIAEKICNEVLQYLIRNKYVVKADPLGSIRRKVSTVGDIDISVATNYPKEVLEYFTQYPKSKKVLEKGDTTASIMLPSDIQVDIMVQPLKSYGSLLQHFTGSKHHNIKLREFARNLNPSLSLSEYGIKNTSTQKIKNCETEEDFYRILGLDLIPPELREGLDEIEISKSHNLPELVELKDIKGDLQIHSDFDSETSHDLGSSTMQDLIEKADKLGYQYIAFTEHNPSVKGHSENDIIEILKKKKYIIEGLNNELLNKYHCIKYVFNSLEIDILPDGSLPLTEKALNYLDFALVSIHSSFEQPKGLATRRVLEALKHDKIKIFAHPTGRLINKREGLDFDWEEIYQFCKVNGKILEINCDSLRLDLPDILVRDAVKRGVKLSLGTDSHHLDHLNNMQYGINVARRGWAEGCDIVNTQPVDIIKKLLISN